MLWKVCSEIKLEFTLKKCSKPHYFDRKDCADIF